MKGKLCVWECLISINQLCAFSFHGACLVARLFSQLCREKSLYWAKADCKWKLPKWSCPLAWWSAMSHAFLIPSFKLQLWRGVFHAGNRGSIRIMCWNSCYRQATCKQCWDGNIALVLAAAGLSTAWAVTSVTSVWLLQVQSTESSQGIPTLIMLVDPVEVHLDGQSHYQYIYIYTLPIYIYTYIINNVYTYICVKSTNWLPNGSNTHIVSKYVQVNAIKPYKKPCFRIWTAREAAMIAWKESADEDMNRNMCTHGRQLRVLLLFHPPLQPATASHFA